MNINRLMAIVLKELRQLRRDRLTFGMILGIPSLQLILFGFAINLDIRHIDAAYVDQAQTVQSRETIARIKATEVVNVRGQLFSPEQLQTEMRKGHISVGIVIPTDFERRLQVRDRPAYQIMVDGSDQTVQAAARQLAQMPLPGLNKPYQGTEIVNFYNPERRAPVNTVPGLIGVILT
ncbi:MAG TPA: ABC transporter permease, partial [Arenimonas sp.]|nr:ABC transporter permease [Arenimonas sp.]